MALIYLLFIAVVFYWQINAVKSGKITKKKAFGLYAGYTIAPVFLYGLVFMVLIGYEELADRAIISEGYARSIPFVIAGGTAVFIIVTLVFSIVILAVKTNNNDSL